MIPNDDSFLGFEVLRVPDNLVFVKVKTNWLFFLLPWFYQYLFIQKTMRSLKYRLCLRSFFQSFFYIRFLFLLFYQLFKLFFVFWDEIHLCIPIRLSLRFLIVIMIFLELFPYFIQWTWSFYNSKLSSIAITSCLLIVFGVLGLKGAYRKNFLLVNDNRIVWYLSI